MILGLYLCVAYVSHADQGFYSYPYLDPAKGNGKVAGFCVGTIGGACVLFGIVWSIIWFRCWAASRLGLDDDKGDNAKRRGFETEPEI